MIHAQKILENVAQNVINNLIPFTFMELVRAFAYYMTNIASYCISN